MKRYAISWYDHFDMCIKMDIIDAPSELEALKVAYKNLVGKYPAEVKNISILKAVARSQDGAIEAIELFEPEFMSVQKILKPFIRGMANAIPTRERLPEYVH